VILDTSAVVAIIKNEPEKAPFLAIMRDSPVLRMGTPTVLELTMVLGSERLDRTLDLLHEGGVQFVDFTAQHLLVAQHAHQLYGRGSGSSAKLNFGDCMTYALAKFTGEPLLFKGDDFTHTDITPAL